MLPSSPPCHQPVRKPSPEFRVASAAPAAPTFRVGGSRRPAALPTLPAPARAQQISTQRASRVAPRADGADMGRAMVARLGLGLLLLALLLPTQIYCNQTSAEPFSSHQNISAAPNPTNATTRGGGSALQSTAGLLAISLSLLHLYC